MKMLKKYAYLLTLAAVAFGFAACSEDRADYEPAQPVSPDCQEVYFASSNPTKVDMTSVEAATASIPVVVSRTYASGAASIPVKLISASEGAFNVPETIEFADGEEQVTLDITMNTPLADGDYSFEIAIEGDEYVNPYTQLGSYAYALTVTIENWEKLGMATIRDDFLTTLYNTGMPVWQCECWTRSTMPGYICLKNCWTSEYPFNAPGEYEEGDVWFYVNIANPNQVIIPSQDLRFCWDPADGNFCIFTMAPGTLKDGVITFPTNGLAIGLTIYTGGKAGWYANTSGMFAIAMPGYDIP
ncbi:MAG: hypothetical protein Q4A18_06705 [Rikenellaceae bacterium]|nr:hypothetical protein [Rikenellaceae bacterium]